jgi:hypothetical protein
MGAFMKKYGGRKSENGGMRTRYSIVSRFLTTSFETSVFRWVHAEGWEQNSLQEIGTFFTAPSLGINRNLGERNSKNLTHQIHPLGSWALFARSQTECLGMVRAVGIFGSFVQVHLHSTVTDSQDLCPDLLWNQAISFLVSALFIGSECDVIKVIPTLRSQRDSMEKTWTWLASGTETQTLWTPLPTMSRLAINIIASSSAPGSQLITGYNIRAYVADRSAWMESDPGKTSAKELHYLVARKTNEKDLEKQRQKKPKRGRWSRFLRWS